MDSLHPGNSIASVNGQKPSEPQNAHNSSAATRHRPLSLGRLLRGLLCLVIYIFSAFMMLVYWAPFATFVVRLFSIHYSRKLTSVLFGAWLALWPFLFEKINRTKVIFSGDTVPKNERVLVVANHRTEVDWMYLWDLALRKHCLGYIKYVLKSSLLKLPIFGWGFHILEFISVERNWEIDESVMKNMLSTFKDRHDPLWLTVFPEGTDFTEKKCIKSQKFAAKNGLPILKNVLLPKTRGFCTSLEILRNSLDSVYDVTIAYKHRCPFFLDNVFGTDPSEVHMHIKRIMVHDIPTDPDDAAAWLTERFQIKDQLLSDFAAGGHFPNEGTEAELSTSKCLLKIIPVIAFTCTFTYLTFFCSAWFKTYVTLSSAYLTTAAFLKIRPCPIFGGQT